jgi:hypothetical protein
MMASRGMGAISPKKIPRAKRRGDNEIVEGTGRPIRHAKGGKVKSKVNEAGNYSKPGMRKALFNSIKNSAVQGTAAGQWSARKAQLLAKRYKEKGGGYKS